MMDPLKRISRMRRMFATNRSVLIEDYGHFTTPHASIPPSRAGHKSAVQNGQQCLKRSEKPSSDRSGG